MTASAPLPLMASVPSTACRAHWVLYPFFSHSKNAVHGAGNVAVSCERTLRENSNNDFLLQFHANLACNEFPQPALSAKSRVGLKSH